MDNVLLAQIFTWTCTELVLPVLSTSLNMFVTSDQFDKNMQICFLQFNKVSYIFLLFNIQSINLGSRHQTCPELCLSSFLNEQTFSQL